MKYEKADGEWPDIVFTIGRNFIDRERAELSEILDSNLVLDTEHGNRWEADLGSVVVEEIDGKTCVLVDSEDVPEDIFDDIEEWLKQIPEIVL